MKELIRTLSKQRIQEISGHRILYPATKKQRLIYNAFDIEAPKIE